MLSCCDGYIHIFILLCSVPVCMQMVSAERVIQYGALQPEASLETVAPNNKPPSDWPEKGDIVMDDASFQYSPDTPLVLNSVCCEIKPSQKVLFVCFFALGCVQKKSVRTSQLY